MHGCSSHPSPNIYSVWNGRHNGVKPISLLWNELYSIILWSVSATDKQEQMEGKNCLRLWYINRYVSRSGCTTGGLSIPNKQSKNRFSVKHLLSAEICNTRGWGIEDLVDLLPLRWSLLGHSFLFFTVDSAHLLVSSLHCSPNAVKVFFLGVWAHRLRVAVAELCIVLYFSVLCLLRTFCPMLNVLEYVSRGTAVAISASSPFLSRLWQTGTHRRPCCA